MQGTEEGSGDNRMVDVVLFPSDFYDVAKVDEDLQAEYDAVVLDRVFQVVIFGYAQWFQDRKSVV